VAEVVSALVTVAELRVEAPDLVPEALRLQCSSGADFADFPIGLVSRARGCSTTTTFDRRAARSGTHTLLS
jgi:predicted nucleic-acid-binding protein